METEEKNAEKPEIEDRIAKDIYTYIHVIKSMLRGIKKGM